MNITPTLLLLVTFTLFVSQYRCIVCVCAVHVYTPLNNSTYDVHHSIFPYRMPDILHIHIIYNENLFPFSMLFYSQPKKKFFEVQICMVQLFTKMLRLPHVNMTIKRDGKAEVSLVFFSFFSFFLFSLWKFCQMFVKK